MIYVLARVTDGQKLLAYMCTDISVEAISKTTGPMNPNFRMVPPQELTDAVQCTRKEMEEKGYSASVASVYNKRNVVNIKLVNGVLQSEVSGGYPTLLASTRNVIPNTPSGIILCEYRTLKNALMGYCLAIFNPQTSLFDLGRAGAKPLAIQMDNAQQAGYNLVSNAVLSVNQDTRESEIVDYAQGFERFTVVEQVTTTEKRENLTKIVTGGDKKKIGKTATTIISNISETAEEVTGNVDMFRALTPEQAKFIQLYYMRYTKQVFECLRKTSRLDISTEKLAKLDMFRVDSDIEWEYTGIKIGSRIGSFTCALGHPLKRAHTAEAKNLLDNSGEKAKLIFGLTCLSDFFNLNSEDIPVLSKAERIMVDEIAYITEMFNNKTVPSGWEKVDLFLHLITSLSTKKHNETTTSLEHLVGKDLADLLMGFIHYDIPYPKSATELFLTNLSYRIGDTDNYRMELGTYITRKKTNKRTEQSIKNRRRVFEEYFGAEGYRLFCKSCKRSDIVLDFLLDAKVQGDFGWDPDNKSSGFRGTHNEQARRIFNYGEVTLRKQYGLKRYTGEEFAQLRRLLNIAGSLGTKLGLNNMSPLATSPYYVKQALEELLKQAGFNGQEDGMLINAIASNILDPDYSQTILADCARKPQSTTLILDSNNRVEDGVERLKASVFKLSNITDAQKVKLDKFKKLIGELGEKPIGIPRDDLRNTTVLINSSTTELRKEFATFRDLIYSNTTDSADFNLHFSFGKFRFERLTDETKITVTLKTDYTVKLGGEQKEFEEMLVPLLKPRLRVQNGELIISNEQGQEVVKLNFDTKNCVKAYFMCKDKQLLRVSIEKHGLMVDEIKKALFANPVSKLFDSSSVRENLKRYKTVKTLLDPIVLDRASTDRTKLCVINFGTFSVHTVLKSIMETGDDTGIFNVALTTQILDTKGKLIYEADSLSKVSRLADVNNPTLSMNTHAQISLLLKAIHGVWVLTPKASGIVFQTNVTEPFTLPANCTLKAPLKEDKAGADKQAVGKEKASKDTAKKGKTSKGADKSNKEDSKPVYSRDEMPDPMDYSNVYHALIYCYNYDEQENKYTQSSDVLLSAGTPYEKLKYGDKAILQRDIAYHVSTYGVDLGQFRLPFEINLFVTSSTEPDLFKSIREAYEYYTNKGNVSEEISFVMSVAQSVIRWNKLTNKQRKHIDKLIEAYKNDTASTV